MVLRMDFNNKIAVITGAGRGIGAAVSCLLAKLGATVALIDCDTPSVISTAKKINDAGDRALAYVADVADMQQIKTTLDRIEQELGPIELLAHVAGVMRASSLLEMSLDDWEYLLKINATGTFIVTTEVGRRMATRHKGAMTIVTSNAATTPRISLGGYAGSKAAAAMMTKSLGLELAQKGVRCNIVSPGSTETQMLFDSLPKDGSLDLVISGNLSQHRLGIPLGRIASPADIAEAVVFLLSDSARHITLSDLRVDGGATLGVS
jgi:2,3-dihydro-2,3-dihydroxybenzoate dehydrogenase